MRILRSGRLIGPRKMVYVIGFIFCVWWGLSPIIWVYWQFHPESRAPHRLELVVVFGMFFGISILLQQGFNSILFFIPSSWELRSKLAACLGFLGFIGFVLICDKVKQLQLKKQDLRRPVEGQDKIVICELRQKD